MKSRALSALFPLVAAAGLAGCAVVNPPVSLSLSVHNDAGEIAPVAGAVLGSAVLGCAGRPDGDIRAAVRTESAARGLVLRLNDGSPSLSLVWLQQGGKGVRIGDDAPGAATLPLIGIVRRDGADWLIDVTTDLRPGVDLPIAAIDKLALLPVPGAMSVALKGRMPALSARATEGGFAQTCGAEGATS